MRIARADEQRSAVRRVRVAAVLAGAWFSATLPVANGRVVQQQLVPRFSSGVSLVELSVTVAGADGGPITDLKSGDFAVYEDGEPQMVTAFAAGSFPLAVAVAVDRSWSMAGEPLALAKAAARDFLAGLRPSDRSMIIAIGSETEKIEPLAGDRASQYRALNELHRWGTTPLYDSIIRAIDLLQPVTSRRALVLLSDGQDRYSHATSDEALDRARRSDVIIYPIALGKEPSRFFLELAVLTGGRSFHQRDPRKLTDTLGSIARELRAQYLLGYTPSRPMVPGSHEWRSIEVKVDRRGTRARTRDGYLVK